MTQDTDTFSGCKIAIFCQEELLVYKRDDIKGIPYPNCWDFPGGGREQQESPEECALRELYEEFALTIPASRIHYKKQVSSHTGMGHSYFLAATISQQELAQIQFGNEGQYWQLMRVETYLNHAQGIDALKNRLRLYLSDREAKTDGLS